MNKAETANKLTNNKEFINEYLHNKKRNIIQLLVWIYRPVFKNIRIVVNTIIYFILNGIVPLFSVVIFYYITKMAVNKNTSNESIITNILILMAIMYLVTYITIKIKNSTYTLFTKIRMKMLKDILNNYMDMSFQLYDSAIFLDEISKWNQCLLGNTTGVEGIYHSVFDMSSMAVSLIIILTWLDNISIGIPIFTVLYILLYNVSGKITGRYKLKIQKEQDKTLRRFRAYNTIASEYKYGKDIRFYGFADRLEKNIRESIKEFTKKNGIFQKHKFMYILPNLILQGIICGYSIGITLHKYYLGEFNISTVMFYLSLIFTFLIYLNNITKIIYTVREDAYYINDMIDLYEKDLTFDHESEKGIRVEFHELEFKNVTFQYSNTTKDVFTNLSFKIKAKEKIALVGINGAGKSTIVKLILGFYKPTQGEILINGININAYSNKDRYKFFSVVFQNPEPLAMTIAQNIACDTQYDYDKIMNILKMVGLYDEVEKSKDSIDTNLLKIFDNDGKILSGGQNQRLAIARALYKDDSKMVIMDEPTAALDSLTESKLYQEINDIFSDKSVLLISHRLASTQFCDVILLLNEGELCEIGTHEELMKQKGVYFAMYEKQSKYYR